MDCSKTTAARGVNVRFYNNDGDNLFHTRIHAPEAVPADPWKQGAVWELVKRIEYTTDTGELLRRVHLLELEPAGPALAGTASGAVGTSLRARKAQAIRHRKDASQAAKRERLLHEPFDNSVPLLAFHDDNQAMVQVMNSGSNPVMRHIGRVHDVSVEFMHQEFAKPYTALGYIDTKKMAADIHTKAYPDSRQGEWETVRKTSTF